MTAPAPSELESSPVPDEVGSLQAVLAALSDPVRLEMVRRLATAQAAGSESVQCSLLYDTVSKSTASHHFKILREAGVIRPSRVDGTTHQQLRAAELDAAYPAVVSSIVGALD